MINRALFSFQLLVSFLFIISIYIRFFIVVVHVCQSSDISFHQPLNFEYKFSSNTDGLS